jgi:hypothetical protein
MTPSRVHSGMALMTDKELSETEGQFSAITLESFYTENDTIRIFMDLHLALYGEINVKAGYYYRSSGEMQMNPATAGPSGFEGFYDSQSYNNGANFTFVKVTSDFNTMAPQNSATIEPWGNGGFSSSNPQKTLTPNSNYYDWDLWVDNWRFGENPDKPIYINGMIMRFEFDGNLTDGNNDKLKRIIVGTNDLQGNIRGNYQRYTGIANPMLLTSTAARSLGSADPYKWTPGSIQMVRDPLVQCFGIEVFNVEDRDTGIFLIMNMKGDHIGYELITGFPENSIDFSYTSGLKSIPLWDPDWTPGCGNGPLVDPYDTMTQIDSHNHGAGSFADK